MKINEAEIRNYAALMREYGLTQLSVAEEGTSVCLTRAAAGAGDVLRESAGREQRAEEASAPRDADVVSVRSPMVGVFYTAAAENAEPFVAVGDRVEEGATLCIIEAMKLMNEIRAEKSGVIFKICATNGQVVEYGTELFQIRP